MKRSEFLHKYTIMDPVIGSALISGAGSVLGSMFSGHQNYKNTKKLMAYQNQMNIENWKMENKYNSPGAQMARLREAGLNPSLVYSSGTDNTGGSIGSSSPASMAGNVDYSQSIPSAVNTYFAAKMQNQQLANMEYQNDYIRAQLNKLHQDTVYQALQNARESAYLGKYPVLAELAVSMAKSELEGSGIGNMLRRQQVRLNDVSMTKIGVEIDNMRKQGKAIDASVAQRWSEIAIQQALAKSNISVNESTINKMSYEMSNLIRTGNLQALEYKMKNFAFSLEQDGKLDPGDNANFFVNLAASLYNNLVVH